MRQRIENEWNWMYESKKETEKRLMFDNGAVVVAVVAITSPFSRSFASYRQMR